MQNINAELKAFAAKYGLRKDWHEPDEQGVNAIVTGTHLDNAMGSEQGSMPAVYQEFVVHLTVDGSVQVSINLASLLAEAAK